MQPDHGIFYSSTPEGVGPAPTLVKTHLVLTDATNKAQEAKLNLAIDMYLEQRRVPDLGDAVPYWAVTFWMTDRLSTFFTTKNPLLFRWSRVALTIIFREHLSL